MVKTDTDMKPIFDRKTACNTGFASGGVTYKLGALYLYSSSVLVDSFVLRNPPERKARKRWEKSPYGTIFPNDRSASPTVGKPSLHSHDVLPTVGLDAFLSGENSLRNDDQAERSLAAIIKRHSKNDNIRL